MILVWCRRGAVSAGSLVHHYCKAGGGAASCGPVYGPDLSPVLHPPSSGAAYAWPHYRVELLGRSGGRQSHRGRIVRAAAVHRSETAWTVLPRFIIWGISWRDSQLPCGPDNLLPD